ncbi:MAG: 50S ribosomal protein L32e [Candidatus Nitrosocosmicus sp.]
MVINKDLLERRKKISDRRPKFKRQESWRYDRLAVNWRKPDGIDNKMRKQYSGYPSLVKIGYGGPKVSRGLHPSGYVDNLVYNVNDLSRLDKDKDSARIAHTVGNKKRLEIITKAETLGIKLLNGKNTREETNQSAIKTSDDEKEQ